MWTRWATFLHLQSSTLITCYKPRWYSSIFQQASANRNRSNLSISRLLVAEWSVMPSLNSIWNTLTKPYPSKWTTVPVVLISHWFIGRNPVRSGFTRRFNFKRVSQCQPKFLRSFRLSKLLYQLLNSTHYGVNPRLFATSSISPKWSFLVLSSFVRS